MWLRKLKSRRNYKSYYDLKIWEKGIILTLKIYDITRNFPEEEKFGLISQMRRCAVSIPSNIAEGYGRYNKKEFAQFLRISKGSLCELDTQLIICSNTKYITEELYNEIAFMMDELQYMLLAFINRCSKK